MDISGLLGLISPASEFSFGTLPHVPYNASVNNPGLSWCPSARFLHRPFLERLFQPLSLSRVWWWPRRIDPRNTCQSEFRRWNMVQPIQTELSSRENNDVAVNNASAGIERPGWSSLQSTDQGAMRAGKTRNCGCVPPCVRGRYVLLPPSCLFDSRVPKTISAVPAKDREDQASARAVASVPVTEGRGKEHVAEKVSNVLGKQARDGMRLGWSGAAVWLELGEMACHWYGNNDTTLPVTPA
jgi:hypothetical protein